MKILGTFHSNIFGLTANRNMVLTVLFCVTVLWMTAGYGRAIEKSEKVKADNIYSEVGDFAAGDDKAPGRKTPGNAIKKPLGEIDPRDLERNQIERRFAVRDLLDPEPIFDWENHHVIGRNREPSRCTQMVYPDIESALEATKSTANRPIREASPYYQLLNGMWKFNWVERPADRPQDFFRIDFDDSAWVEIPVPNNMGLKLAHYGPTSERCNSTNALRGIGEN